MPKFFFRGVRDVYVVFVMHILKRILNYKIIKL